jgi:hypothetical protein
MAWACASMSGGGAMASLLASSSVAAIFTPSLGLQWDEKKRNTQTEIRTRTDSAKRDIAQSA